MLRVLAASGLLALCQTVHANDEWAVFFDRAGSVRIGMTVPQLSKALGKKIAVPTDPHEASCFYASPRGREDIWFMIVKGIVSRIDVSAPSIPAIRGARVGQSIAEVRRAFGSRIEETPHFYSGLPDIYLLVRSKSGRYGLRFETRDGKVSVYYAGRFPEVEFVEGCQ